MWLVIHVGNLFLLFHLMAYRLHKENTKPKQMTATPGILRNGWHRWRIKTSLKPALQRWKRMTSLPSIVLHPSDSIRREISWDDIPPVNFWGIDYIIPMRLLNPTYHQWYSILLTFFGRWFDFPSESPCDPLWCRIVFWDWTLRDTAEEWLMLVGQRLTNGW